MKQFKEWLNKLFGSSDGVSSKRVIGIVGYLTMMIYAICTANQSLLEGCLYVAAGFIAGTVIDKAIYSFGKKNGTNN